MNSTRRESRHGCVHSKERLNHVSREICLEIDLKPAHQFMLLTRVLYFLIALRFRGLKVSPNLQNFGLCFSSGQLYRHISEGTVNKLYL